MVVVVVAYDLTQRRHAVLRNFPIIGHFRYLLEGVGPELRQYIVVDNDAEKPFSRDQRRWIYTAAKQRNTYFGFGTDNDLEASPGYLIIKQSSFPLRGAASRAIRASTPEFRLPAAKVLGGARRTRAGVPAAVDRQHLEHELRLARREGDRGAQPRRRARRVLQGTGEGGISPSTATAATSSGRSAPATSGVATPRGASTSRAFAT